jgi:hypothetical protein
MTPFVRAFVAGCVLVLPVRTVQAQRMPASAFTATEPTQASPKTKSPQIAAVLGMMLPGSGHWYAEEHGRGWLIAALYWTGVALVHGGRTDELGVVGGVLVLGGWGYAIADGASAATRYNRRTQRSGVGVGSDCLTACGASAPTSFPTPPPHVSGPRDQNERQIRAVTLPHQAPRDSTGIIDVLRARQAVREFR